MNRRGQDRIGPLGSSGVIAKWGGSSIIRSVQDGSANMQSATTVNATITAVDMANAICLTRGSQYTTDADQNDHCMFRAALTSSTNVQMVRQSGGSGTINCAFIVLEFNPGILKSLQAGTITMGGGQTTATTTITSVQVAKSMLFWAGTSQSAGSAQASAWATIAFDSSTQVRATRNSGVAGHITQFVVAEFF